MPWRTLDAALAADALNALPMGVAVLNAEGVIVAVNREWVRFGSANGAEDERAFIGSSYLSACEQAMAAGDESLADTVAKLRALLAGTADRVEAEYPCDSPAERRWFKLTASPLPDGRGIVIAHEDITMRRNIEQSLRETDRMLMSVLEALPVGIWLVDRDGVIVQANPAGVNIWRGARYVGPEGFGEYKGWWLDSGRKIEPEEWAASRAIRKGETSLNEEVEIECFDGTRKAILNSAIPLFDEQQRIQGAIIVNEDITERKRREDDLRRAKEIVESASRELSEALARERVIARVDSLTGAATRRHFFDLAEQGISVALRYERPLSLILFDLDAFKYANDTLGHQAGDELLKRIAAVVAQHLRDADVFARYGGDEFIVLLPQTAAEDALVVAERIREAISGQAIVTAKGVAHVTISVGIAALNPPDDTLDAMIQRADLALYEAKSRGRNCTRVFSSAFRQRDL